MKQLTLHCYSRLYIIGEQHLAEQEAKRLNDKQMAALVDIFNLKGDDQERARVKMFSPLLLRDPENHILGWVVISHARPMQDEETAGD